MSDDFETIANEYEEEYIPRTFQVPDAGTYKLVRDAEGFKAGVKADGRVPGGKYAWFGFKSRIVREDGSLGAYVDTNCNTGIWGKMRFHSVREFVESAGEANPRYDRTRLIEELESQGETKNKMSVLEAITGPFTAKVDWTFRCIPCAKQDRNRGTFLVGQHNPESPDKYNGLKPTVAKDDNGKTAQEQTCPNCDNRVKANLEVTNFVVKAKNATTAAVVSTEVAG